MNEDFRKLEDLVPQARAGDMGAFEALYQRHQAGIYMFLRSQVHDAELAADLTQQTFVRAWESLARLREPGAFQSWLHRIALNLVRDEAKSGRARLEVVATDLGDERTGAAVGEAAARDPTPEALALSSELRDRVWQALGSVSAEQRAALVMHHMTGMSVGEIARAMKVRPGTVMSRLARGREALRKLLGSYVEGQNGSM